MSDVNAIINIDIDSSSALLNLKRLENQIDQFNRSISTSNATAAASQQSLNRALLDGINNTGLFNSKIVPVESSMTRFSRSLDEGRLSLGEYTRFASSQLPGLSRVFKKEFDSIEQVATSRVKSMQAQYLALGKTVDGVTKTIASTPTGLSKGLATDLAMIQQRQQVFNKLLDDGSTKLLNWGKNTQWAGRQLMVGFTLPLAAFGAVASKTFMEIDKATISLKRVYGDLSTTKEELDSNVQAIKGLGKEYTKYGITLAQTIELSGRAAATGATNEKLMAATEQTLRFATLGQMDYNQALDTTISLQTAFAISNEDLGKTVDYLNAVENQTILTMEDMSVAIPRVATVVKGLGGDVQDLAVMMTAMREGGVSAENAANGLKSGLASLINPTKRASESLGKMGVNLNSIISQNKGDLMGIVTEFGTAINKLDEFSRQQVLEQVFGKFQYARMSALFTNITKDAGQAARAMDIAGMSAEELAKISEKELGQISESTSVKFQAAMEQLKMSIAPIGEAFLKGITPIVNMVTKIADAFNNLPDGVKNAVAVLTGIVAGLGPVFLMTIGLLGNGLANLVKGFQFFRKMLAGIKGDASAFTWLAQGELEAVTASKALEGSATNLTDKLLLQRGAVAGLTAEYERFAVVAGIAGARMGGMGGGAATRGAAGKRPLPSPREFATGGTIPGSGNTDTVPAMLTPGEFVINKKATAQNLPLLHAINNGQGMGGFNKGGQIPGVQYFKKAGIVKPKIVQPVRGIEDIIKSLQEGIDRPGRRAPSSFKTVQRRIYEPIEASVIQQIFELGGGDPSYKVSDSRKRWMQTHVAHLAPRVSQTSAAAWKASNLRYTSGAENLTLNDIFSRGMLNPEKRQFIESIAKENGLDKILKKVLQKGHHPNTKKEYEALETLLGAMKEQKNFKSTFKSVDDQANVSMLLGLTRIRNNPNSLPSLGANAGLFTGNLRSIDDLLKDPNIRKLLGVQSHNSGGPILGGQVTQGRPFYGVFNAKTIDMFRNWIGTHSEAIPALRQTILKDPKMRSMFGSAFLKSKKPETLLRSQFMSSIPEIGSELSLGALRSFSAEGTDVVRHLADSKVRKGFEDASYMLGVDQKKQKRDAARLRKAETVGLPSWSPEHKYRSPVGGATGIDAWMEDTRRSIEQRKAGIKESKSKIREYNKLTPTVIRLKTPSGTIRANLDDIVPQIEQQYGTSGSSYQVQEQERILNNARIKINGKSTDKNGITTLDAELIESFGLNKGGTIPGSGNTDTVPAMLTPGEFVVNKKATQSNIDLLHAINNNGASQSMQKFNKGGMIGGIQYFEDGGGVQSSRGGYYGAPPQIKAQTRDMPQWSTQNAEMLAATEAARALGATTAQIENNLNRVAAHLVEGQGDIKDWVANNLMTDLQAVNQYMNRVPKVAQTILTDTEMIGRVATQTGLSASRVRDELELLVKRIHPSTVEAASVLRNLSELDAQASLAVQQARQSGANVGRKTVFGTNSDTGYLAAMTSATLQERLQGDFYQTLGSRAYVTPEGGYQTYRGGASGTQSLPTSVVEDFKGITPGPSNEQRKEMRRQAQEEVAGSPVSQYASAADKKKLENQIYERRVIEETQKERLKLIDDEAAFLKEQGVDHDKAMKIAEKTVDEGKAGIARQKKERRFQNTVVPVGTQSLPILTAEELQQIEFERNQIEEESRRSKKTARRQKVGKGLKGAGGAMGMASMLPFMMQNEEGKFMGMDANMLGMGMMVGGMAMPAVGSAIAGAGGIGAAAVAAPIAAFLVPLAAGAVALKIYSDKVNDASRAAADMGANLGVTANSLNKIGGLLGTSTPAQRRQQTSLNLSNKELSQSFGEFGSILQSEGGQGFIQELKNATSTERAKKFTDYLKAGVASGMLSSDQARKFADVMGVAVGDSLMSTLAKKGLLGIDGAGSKSYLELSRQRKEALPRADVDALKTAIDKALAGRQLPKSFPVPGGKAGAGVGISIQTQNQRQTIDPLLAASAVGSSLQIIQDYSNTVQLAREDLDAGKITQKEYSAIVKESMENQKIYSETISDAITYSRDQGPTLKAIEEQFKSLGMTAEEIGKFADSVSGVGKEDIGKYYAEAAAAAVQGMLPSDIQTITDYALGEGKGGTAARTLTNQKYAGQGYGLSALAMSVEQGGILGLDKEQSQQTVDVAFRFTEQGGTVAEYQQFLMTLPKNKIVTIQTKLEGMSAPDLYKFTKGFNDIGAKGGIDLAVNVMFDENGNPVTGKELSETVKKTEAALNKMGSSKKKVKKEGSIQLLTQIRGADGEQLSRKQAEEQWDSLVKQFGEQKILNLPTDILTKVLDLDVEISADTLELIDLDNKLKTATGEQAMLILKRMAEIRSNRSRLQGQQAGLVSSNQPPRTPDGGDDKKGGGGAKDNPLLNLKKSILDQIKMYVDINATMKKLNDQKYKFADMISGSNGVFDKLRGLKGTAGGLSDSVVDVIAGMGPDAAKAWMKKNAKGGKLTKEGQNQADLIFAGGVRGTVEGNLTEFRGARAQRKAYRNLRGKGLDNSVVEAIAGDPEKAKQLEGLQQRINAGIKGSVKDMRVFINSQIKATKEAELLARAQDPIQTKIDDITMAHKINSVEIDKQVKIYEDQITAINKEITAIQELNSKDQNRIRDLDRQKEMINRQIESLNRANELDQRRAEGLRREDEIRNRSSESLSRELDIMSQQETNIKESYDKRVKALDEVAKINDHIINQQRSQLGLAQALSQGDAYAAAAARDDMQTNSAKFAQEQMRASLQTGMENQISGLTTAGGLTRDQAEAQINAIKEQSYQTSLLIRDIEDAIYQRNLAMIPLKDSQLVIDDQIRVIQDAMYVRETEIIKIQTGKLADTQKQLDKELEIKKALDDKFDSQVADYELQKDIVNMTDAQGTAVAKLSEKYRGIAEQIDNINKLAAKQTDRIAPPVKDTEMTKKEFDEKWREYKDKVDAIEAKRRTDAAAVVASMTPVNKAVGGLIGDGARDSIPAMLTPGEFVMRKASVQKYGMPMLSSMNMGAFDMPKYNTDSQASTAPTIQAPSVVSSITAPVYNTYSVSVNANTNASPDDIANKVIMKIKSIESRSIRSTNGY